MISKFKLVAKFLYTTIPKFLDFSDYGLSKSRIKKLETEIRDLQYRIYNSNEMDKYYLELANLIVPKFVKMKSDRVGATNDGGYLIPKLSNAPKTWLTIGLGQNCEFENQMAAKKFQVFTFDHTLKHRPKHLQEEVVWIKKGWGKGDPSLISISNLMAEARIKSDWGLKFDIEGSEWEVLDQIANLKIFPIIITCELHDLNWSLQSLNNKKKLQTLKSLLRKYDIIAINGNNYSASIVSRRVTLDSAIEITFLLKSALKITKLRKRTFSQKNNLNNKSSEASIFEIRARP